MAEAKHRVKQVTKDFILGLREDRVLSEGGIRVDSVRYSFAEDTGAQATVSTGRKIPAGAIVTKVVTDEITALTSAGAATLQVKAGSTNLTGAVAFDTGFTGVDEQALDGAVDGIKVTEDSEIVIEIAGADLTAGEVRAYVHYIVQNDKR